MRFVRWRLRNRTQSLMFLVLGLFAGLMLGALRARQREP